jgi:hypothetical protein
LVVGDAGVDALGTGTRGMGSLDQVGARGCAHQSASMAAARCRRCSTRGTWVGPPYLPRLSLHPERNGRQRAPVHRQARERWPETSARFGPKLNEHRHERARAPDDFARPLAAATRRYHGRAQDETCIEARTLTSKRFFCLTAHRLTSCIKFPAALASCHGARRAQAQDPEDAPRPGVGGVCALS